MWVVAVEVRGETELSVVQTSGEDRGAALWDPEWGVMGIVGFTGALTSPL